jgi:hypothetical protein
MASRYPNRISALFSACVVAVLLCIPWPDAKGPSFAKSIWLTFRDLNKNAVATIGRYRAFQSDLTTPGSGEHVLPTQVQEALAIVRGRGRAVKRYELSPSLREDDWVFQQFVVALWPRRLEDHATARFVLNRDPAEGGWTLIDRQQDVSLVYCP